jgi:hypothetical protein
MQEAPGHYPLALLASQAPKGRKPLSEEPHIFSIFLPPEGRASVH